MDQWCSIIVKYGGKWNNCEYEGGEERLAHIPSVPISITNLKENINYIMQACSISDDYTLNYLTNTHGGRVLKSVLSTDQDLYRICILDREPTVYVVHNIRNDGGASSHQEPYVPLEPSSTTGFHSTYPSYEASLEEIQRFVSSDWFSDPWMASGSISGSIDDGDQYLDPWMASGSISGPTNDAIQFAENDGDQFAGDGGGTIDESNDELLVEETDDEDEDEEFTTTLMHGTFAEFASWIRREGGINELMSMVLQENPPPISHERDQPTDELTNWLIPFIPLDASDSLVVGDLEEISNEKLSKGSVFWNKGDLNIAVGLWHMKQRAEYKTQKSNHQRVVYICKHHNRCSFELRASCRSELWYVYKFEDEHHCNRDLGHIAPRKVKSRVVATYFSHKMRKEGAIMKPNDIVTKLLREFGIRASYSVALRARNNAIEMIYGRHEDSFQILPSYLFMLQQKNHGTMTDLDIGPDGRFQHLLVALGACRIAYTTSLRPVIVVDGTHLKGRNKGILFFAVTKDDNEQCFPLAVGVGPIENDVSWTWFMERLKMAFGVNPDMLIVSDQHISINNAIKNV